VRLHGQNGPPRSESARRNHILCLGITMARREAGPREEIIFCNYRSSWHYLLTDWTVAPLVTFRSDNVPVNHWQSNIKFVKISNSWNLFPKYGNLDVIEIIGFLLIIRKIQIWRVLAMLFDHFEQPEYCHYEENHMCGCMDRMTHREAGPPEEIIYCAWDHNGPPRSGSPRRNHIL
jgi:hypothetical protein